jgi:DNA-binding transcriptional regulator YiaG
MSMAVTFRNVEVSAGTPVQHWPYEAIVTVIERGTVTDWALLTTAIREDPWGVVARQVESYLGYSRPWGVAPLLERTILAARQRAEQDERAAVASEMRDLLAASGLTTAEFASRIGTSRSRLSTYLNGRVTPSAALLLRMRRLVATLQGGSRGRSRSAQPRRV